MKIDLYMATDHKDVERAIIKGVNSIIAQVTGVTDKILNSIKSYIRNIKPTLEMGTDGMKLVLEPSTNAGSQENICEACAQTCMYCSRPHAVNYCTECYEGSFLFDLSSIRPG